MIIDSICRMFFHIGKNILLGQFIGQFYTVFQSGALQDVSSCIAFTEEFA